ncbi:MAG: 30S ribosomal protein S13 [archaeon]|jgi:small subunit ribosomal protein S13
MKEKPITLEKIQGKEKPEKEKKVFKPVEKTYYSIVRILQTDIPGNKKLLVGLTYIKGVSWAISNATCKILKLDENKKISDLNEKEINVITEFLKNPTFPKFLLNRRNDFETGKDSHLIGSDLDMKKEFDIRRLKKIRSYRGLRHALGQPTRGQRTRSHFRSKGKKKAVGVKSKSTPSPAPAKKAK